MIVWIIASAVAMLPTTQTTTLVQQSKVVTTLDSLVPNQVRDSFMHLRDVVGQGAFPKVFSGIVEVVGPEVDAPNESIADTIGVVTVLPRGRRAAQERKGVDSDVAQRRGTAACPAHIWYISSAMYRSMARRDSSWWRSAS